MFSLMKTCGGFSCWRGGEGVGRGGGSERGGGGGGGADLPAFCPFNPPFPPLFS